MVETTFNIVYRGKILDGHDFDTAKYQLVEQFALSQEKAELILKSNRVILKKNLNESAARKLGVALKKAGLDVVLMKNIPPAASQKPETPPLSPKAGTTVTEQQGKAFTQTPASEEKKEPPKKIGKSNLPFEFNGTGSEYFKIWIVNIILSIITLGIYSAWAKVRRKQYFYGSTRLQGSSFEYLADPVKILKGRVIVAVYFIFYSVISELVPIVGMILSFAFLFILPWLVVRSLAFNARNSAYRNIRFGFNGTIKEAARVYILWPILTPFTLGILFPYVYFRQKKFIVENSSYGKTKFTFKAVSRDYYSIFISALIPIVIGILVSVGGIFLFPPIAILVSLVIYLYLFAYFSVKTTNLLYNSTELSAHKFNANLQTMEYLTIVVTNSLGTAVTLGIFYPWAHVRALRYKLNHLVLKASGDLEGFIAEEQEQVSAVGDEMSDFFDIDFGL